MFYLDLLKIMFKDLETIGLLIILANVFLMVARFIGLLKWSKLLEQKATLEFKST
jgi:hypothetical protein